MAYTPNILISQKNTKSITFEDLSFIAFNPSAITLMTIDVVNDAEEVSVTIDLEDYGFATDSQVAEIPNTAFGLDEDAVIPDGLYEITYTMQFTGDEAVDDVLIENWVFVANIENHLFNKFIDINEYYFDNNPLRVQYVNELVAAKALIIGMKYAGRRGLTDAYSSMLTSLQRLYIFEDYDT